MSVRGLVLAGVALVAGLAPLPGQTNELADRAARPERQGQPLDGPRALLLWRITVTLRLDPPAARRVFDTLELHRHRRADWRRQRRELMQEIENAIRQRPEDAVLSALVDRWQGLQRQRQALGQARWRDLQPMLSTQQLAQLMVLLPRLEAR